MLKDLIVYYSKNGTTEETIERIKKSTGKGFDTLDLKEKTSVDLNQYDRIFIGCGVYTSHLPSKIVKFIKANSSILKDKKNIFFIHGLISEEKFKEIVDSTVSGNIPSNKYETVYLGGKLDITKQNFIVRKMLTVIAKQANLDPNNANTLNEQKISELLKYFTA